MEVRSQGGFGTAFTIQLKLICVQLGARFFISLSLWADRFRSVHRVGRCARFEGSRCKHDFIGRAPSRADVGRREIRLGVSCLAHFLRFGVVALPGNSVEQGFFLLLQRLALLFLQ